MMVFAVLAIVLAWLVVSKSLAVYLAEVAPQIALRLNPQQPSALVNLADRSLNPSTAAVASADVADQAAQGPNPAAPEATSGSGVDALGLRGGQDSGNTLNGTGDASSGAADSADLNYAFKTVDQNQSVDLAVLRGFAQSALMSDPLNPRALRILAQVADAAGDKANTKKFMEAAAQLSLHESIAVYWLMLKAIEAGDNEKAIAYADALMRTQRGASRYAVPVLVHLEEQKATNGLVKAVLQTNPPWRDMFFAYLYGSMSDVRTPLDILLALKTSPVPPSSRELGDYLAFLIGHKFYDLAYYSWLQFLSPEELNNAGLLFNGDFESTPSGLPFDWVITQGSGVTIDIVPRPDKNDEHALLVDFSYGRVDYHSVSELVLLAPGTYQFEGKYKGTIVGPRGMKWRLVCAGTEKRIGESAMMGGSASNWKEVTFVFTVPSADCRAQYVQLDLDARTASERLVTGSMLFDQLQISRVDSASDSQQSVE